jgi:hypothetical protein
MRMSSLIKKMDLELYQMINNISNVSNYRTFSKHLVEHALVCMPHKSQRDCDRMGMHQLMVLPGQLRGSILSGMIFRFLKKLSIVLFIQMAVGCVAHSAMEAESSGTQGKAPDAPDITRVYPPVQEEDLRSLTVDRPFFFQAPMPLEYEPVNIDRIVRNRDGEPPSTGGATTVAEGFRVQLLSSRNPGIIDLDEDRLRLKYGHSVYLIYEAPFYKLRLGDFQDMESANSFCRQLQQDGYREAWVVKSPIVLIQE